VHLMAARSARKTAGILAFGAFLALGEGRSTFAQSPKPPIVPPSMKSTPLPELDLFTPPPKKQSAEKPAAKPAPISETLPQAPRFAPTLTTAKRPVHMALPTRQPKPAPAPIGKPVVEMPEPSEPPIGTAPEPLPPPVEQPEPMKPTTPEPQTESPWADVDANSIYRPLAAVVMESEARLGGGEPLWQGTVVPTLPQQTPWPNAVPAPSVLMSPIEERPDISSPIIGGDNSWSDHWLRVAPSSLLWQPPLANPREPRMSAKALRIEGENVFDAAVGGQFGLLRISPDRCPDEGFQLDVFAVVLSRFHDGGLSALDYRFGIPLAYASGCWQFKLAYEHTRNRIQGDVLTLSPDAAHEFRREEAVVGVARTWGEILHAYGQVGVTVSGTAIQKDEPFRYNVGVEWADLRCTTPTGAPFAAVDFEARGDQDYEANVTIQAGWNWRGGVPGRGPRIAAEYHRGYSPFGQIFTQREDWYGVVACLDW
jgi:hypothetical protein